MTQMVLVLQIASQSWCLLLGRISNESKARPRQCNCSARPGAVAREDATCYRDAPSRGADRCGGLPAKQGSVEEEISRRSDRAAPKGKKTPRCPPRPEGKQEIDHKKG